MANFNNDEPITLSSDSEEESLAQKVTNTTKIISTMTINKPHSTALLPEATKNPTKQAEKKPQEPNKEATEVRLTTNKNLIP